MDLSIGPSGSPLNALDDLLSGIGEGVSQLGRLMAGSNGPLAGVVSPDVVHDASLDLLEQLPVVGGLVGPAEDAAKGLAGMAANLPVIGDLMRDVQHALDTVAF